MTKKRKKYSDSFNEIFTFFYKSHRSGILTFCGQLVEVFPDLKGPDGSKTIFDFENGRYKQKDIFTRHPNIVKSIIIGKKSWGLFLNQWTDGIVEGSFTLDEILEEFDSRKIKIPETLLGDFVNRINSRMEKRKIW